MTHTLHADDGQEFIVAHDILASFLDCDVDEIADTLNAALPKEVTLTLSQGNVIAIA